jgi:hypothetical protein
MTDITRTRVAAALGLLSIIVSFVGFVIHGYPTIGASGKEIALLTMLMLACSFGSSVLRMLFTNARRQGAICSSGGDDRRWLAVAHDGPSFLGVFRL